MHAGNKKSKKSLKRCCFSLCARYTPQMPMENKQRLIAKDRTPDLRKEKSGCEYVSGFGRAENTANFV
jgi:hypothetical protein